MRQILDCLQKIAPEELIRKSGMSKTILEELEDEAANLYFLPTIDANSRRAFMPQLPVEALMHGRVKNLPFLVGQNAQDGAGIVARLWDKLEVRLEKLEVRLEKLEVRLEI